MNREMVEQVAARLQAASVKLLRNVRRDETGAEISAPRLAALAAVVASGPLSLAELAAAEQVRAPTMSRTVDALVRQGLVTREVGDKDRRSVRISATEAGHALLHDGRQRRVRLLASRLDSLSDSEKRALLRGIEILERVGRLN